MTAIPTFRTLRNQLASAQSHGLFPFLAPSIPHSSSASPSSIAQFSTSSTLWKGDNNKKRGLSILRSTGPRKRQTSLRKLLRNDLPKPASRDRQRIQGDEDHGLWGFFKDKKLLQTPVEESRHGREWTVSELRMKSWEDLHALWWLCVKERNRLATEQAIRDDIKYLYGDQENKRRDETVQQTMKAILDTLQERHTAWKGAEELAASDPSIDLENNTHIVNPYSVDPEDYQEPEADNVQPAYQSEGSDQPAAPKGAKVPDQFFNAQDEQPTLKEKMKEKAQKVLWNK